jgi:WD40 repeat protein
MAENRLGAAIRREIVGSDAGSVHRRHQQPAGAAGVHGPAPRRQVLTGRWVRRIYKISDNQGRPRQQQIREFEQQAGPVHSVAWSADGKKVCLGSIKEARIYAEDGKKLATLSGNEGAVFAVAFSPDGKQVCTGGFDGMVRIFDAEKGTLIKAFAVVQVESSLQAAR